jgi:serine protease Do
MRNLPRIVAETDIHKQVPVTIWRDGKEQTLSVTVGELADDQQQAAQTPDQDNPAQPQSLELSGLGMQVAPITADARDKYQLGQDQKGVLVTGVTQGTPAADRGLKAGDVIVEVQQEEVSTPGEVQDRIEKLRKDGRASVLMLVQSSDGLRWVPLSLKPNPQRPPG